MSGKIQKIEEKLDSVFSSFTKDLERILEMKLDENLIKNKEVFTKEKPEGSVTSKFSTTKGGAAGEKSGFDGKKGPSGECFCKDGMNDVSKKMDKGIGDKVEGTGKSEASEEQYVKLHSNDIRAQLTKEGYSPFTKEKNAKVQTTEFSKDGVKKSETSGFEKTGAKAEEYAKGHEKADETKEGEISNKDMGTKEKPKYGEALKDKKSRFPRNTGTAKVVGKALERKTVDGEEADEKGVEFFKK